MNKPIIGIISNRVEENDRPFLTKTSFNETYPRRIIQAGGVPVGVIFPFGKFNTEVLDLCDGFVLQGGSFIYSSNINTVHYAIQNDKPILGICMGFQTMVGYDWVREKFGFDSFTYEDVASFFKPEDEVNFIVKKSGHNNLNSFYLSQIDKSKHMVLLSEDSKLARIFGNTSINVPSVHSWCATDKVLGKSNSMFKVTGKSNDGNIEAIESIDSDLWAIGVQFHPELEDKNLALFEELVLEAKIKKLRK